jgi:hypothetical protein
MNPLCLCGLLSSRVHLVRVFERLLLRMQRRRRRGVGQIILGVSCVTPRVAAGRLVSVVLVG